jgi:aspartate 1-decarboxylase
VILNGSGFASFSDVLSHSFQNGAYFIVQVDPSTAVWLNGASAGTVNAGDFVIAS